MTKKLKIRDLTLRDGQQSLFATRMSQATIDSLLPYYENAGFYIMEVWGGAVPDSVMRYLDESPWTRLRTISKAMKGKSLLSALSRGRNLFGYSPYPNDVLEGFYKEAIKNGLNIMRIFDALNDIDNVKDSIKMISKLGGIADGAVCYTIDPKDDATKEKIFTDEYFVTKAKEMEALGAEIITLKDMAGLVTPERAASIISALKANVKVPVDFHTHCTPGYGLASALMAILNDVDILDTNIWWYGGGSAAPAIELIYIFCQKLGVEIDVNMEAVGEIRNHLLAARKSLADFDLNKEHMQRDFDPLNQKLRPFVDQLFDLAIECAKKSDWEGLLDACHDIEDYFGFPKPNEIVKHAEVPGGMYSNMVAQLKALNSIDMLNDAMALIPKVRRDAGLVPLVTPTSQIVGSQAVLLAVDRKNGKADYTQKSNQFIGLIKGEYGHTPAPIVAEFREKIAGTPTETPYDVASYKKPENPELPEFGGVKLAQNDEEYLLLELLPNVANGFLKKRRKEEYEAKHGTKAEAAAATPEEEVVEESDVTGDTLNAPMGGKVLEINIKEGDVIKPGQPILVYEAMKMENDLEADKGGKVKRILINVGDVMATDQPILEFDDGKPVAAKKAAPAPKPVEKPVAKPEPKKEEPKADAEITGPTLTAPMGGKVLEVTVKAGDTIKSGDTVLVYEAMKMENDLTADRGGKIKRVLVQADDVMATDQPIIEFEA